VPLAPQPDERRGRARSKVEEAEERAALAALDPSSVDPAVEAELSSLPGKPPEDEDEWIEWAKSKLGPGEAAGAE
jgi:hypothetical protein